MPGQVGHGICVTVRPRCPPRGAPPEQPFVVSGNVALSGAHLETEFLDTTLLRSTLTLIRNDSPNAVGGTFAGLAEGAVVQSAIVDLGIVVSSHISYVGGDGNDVTLTPFAVLAPPHFTSLLRLVNGVVELQGTATPGAIVKIEGSEDLEHFQLLATTEADGSGQFTFLDNPGALVKRFYRAFTHLHFSS